MQQKSNFVLFIVLCLLVLVGWTWLQGQLWPPRPKAKEDDKKAAEKKEPKKEKDVKEQPARRFTGWTALPGPVKQAASGAGPVAAAPGFAPPGMIASLLFPPEDPKITEHILGGSGYFLEAVATTKGGGLRRVTFTKVTGFKAADSLGRPTDEPLHLIPDDPIHPSYLLYHYASADDERPLLTLGERIWRIEGQPSPEEVRFSTTVPDHDLTIIKTYRLSQKDYHIGMTLEIKSHRPQGKGKPFRYQIEGPRGVPLEGVWYTTVYRNAVIGRADPRGSLWRDLEDSNRISIRQGGDKVVRDGDKFIRYAGVMNSYFAALIVQDDKQPRPEQVLAWARPTLETTETPGKILTLNGKFLELEVGNRVMTFELLQRAIDNARIKELKSGQDAVVSSYEWNGKKIAAWIRPGQALQGFTDDITVRVNSEPIELAADESVTHSFLLYHGPAKVKLLSHFTDDRSVPDDLVDRYNYTLNLNTLTDYPSMSWVPGFWTDILVACTKLMHGLLYYLSFLVPNYGVSIILLTVVVRGLMFPISRKQALLSIRMQALAPELKKIQEKYKNDKQAKMQASMELYRKHGANPLAGCLPMLMQLPIFLGLYFALQESIHFRLAGFLWIRNLAAPDMMIWWGEGIPWISDPDKVGGFLYLGPYFNLLPVCAVLLMLVQQKLMMPPPQDEQQAFQQKIFKWMMILFGIMFYKVAAGLCLYFIASSLWGLAERQLLPKKKPLMAAAAAAPPMPPPKGLRTRPRPGDKDKDKKPDGAFQKVKDWWADILKQAKKK
jgi:YidC/Oxa1 family membrane protein insertase